MIKSRDLSKWNKADFAHAHLKYNFQFRGRFEAIWPQDYHIWIFSFKYHNANAFLHLKLFLRQWVWRICKYLPNLKKPKFSIIWWPNLVHRFRNCIYCRYITVLHFFWCVYSSSLKFWGSCTNLVEPPCILLTTSANCLAWGNFLLLYIDWGTLGNLC